MKILRFSEAVNEAIDIAMTNDKSLICYGLGVTDPKGVFGTTIGLEEKYGSDRVFDMPTSENAMTGVAIGASLNGIRSVVTHQRLDFFLLAMDQLINSAAKWHYMFGSQISVPITIRLIIGRGWGQGPTHSQNLQAWFAHIPGLKVVMPSNAKNAKGLLLSSLLDPNPVIFLEHRWLHDSKSNVPEGDFVIPLGESEVHSGKDITIVSMSYMTVEALLAKKFLQENYRVSCEIVDLLTISPLDFDSIYSSVSKTKKILVLDTGYSSGSVAGEIIAKVCMKKFESLTSPPERLAMPDVPEPTSFALTKGFHVTSKNIVDKVLKMCKIEVISGLKTPEAGSFHDVPGEWFKGPF
jgi:pyruvate dehydrogenase E1 component beta subunit